MTTVALGRGLSVLINPADVSAVADGVLVNAVWAVGQMVARPRESRRTAAGLDTAAWADTEGLIKDALADVAASREFPALSEQDAAELTVTLERHEVQGALQALLASGSRDWLRRGPRRTTRGSWRCSGRSSGR